MVIRAEVIPSGMGENPQSGVRKTCIVELLLAGEKNIASRLNHGLLMGVPNISP